MGVSRRFALALLFLGCAQPALPDRAHDPDRKPAPAEHGRAGHPHGHDATVRHRFDDVDRWVAVFDDPSRDAWQQPERVVRALHLRRGDTVADVGAGTGYFERHLARAVGPSGAVLAADVEPSLVAHLRERAEAEGTPNVVPVLASYDNPRLPPRSVDLVLLVDTYHHVDDRVAYFQGLRQCLTRRGRVALVDWHDGERPVGPPPDHALPKAHVVAEMEEAGYRLVADHDFLPHQVFLIFRPR